MARKQFDLLRRNARERLDRVAAAVNCVDRDGFEGQDVVVIRGDAQTLYGFRPKGGRLYRLKLGDVRVVFELDAGDVVVWRVVQRKDAY